MFLGEQLENDEQNGKFQLETANAVLTNCEFFNDESLLRASTHRLKY